MNKIAIRLSMNFAVALLLFSLVISGIFLFLFKNYTIEAHKSDLEDYAQSLAEALSDDDSGPAQGMGGMGGMGGYGKYFRFINQISDTDVWIIDKDLNLLSSNIGHGMMHGGNKYSQLPTNFGEIIDGVFKGKTVFSEGFSDVLSKSTLTVGVPIKNEKGDIWGAVLLHSPVYGTKSTVNKGASILGISILLALLITIALSLILSYSFTKPLSKMKVAALRLSAGDYSAKSGVKRQDEIGELSEILDLLAMRLDEASKQSQRLEQMRSDFIANISHELRTPITVMRGSLEALYEKVVTGPDKVDEYYRQMLDEAKFLERLVGDLLDLARLQAVDFAIEMEDVNICDVLSDVKRSASKLAKKKEIKLETNFTDPCLRIRGDFGRLRQMFLAVIDNAIKFSPQGSCINISSHETMVSIRDWGPGIAPEELPYIFDRFSKTHDVLNKSGSGLGLAIAKQIAERHGIKLRAKNHEDGGTLFTFDLF